MNPYVEKLKLHLLEQSPDYGYGDASSLLEMLYYYYTTANPINSESIRDQFKELDNILTALPLEENDAVFDVTCDLCMGHAHHAFLEGIHVGVRLITELSEY